MVNPQPVERPVGDQLKDEAVGVGEHDFVFHPQPGERLDVEEPPVGQFLVGGSPVSQAVVLPAQQLVQSVRVTVHRLDLGVDGRRYLRFGLAQLTEQGAQLFLAAVPDGHVRRVDQNGHGQPAVRGRQLF